MTTKSKHGTHSKRHGAGNRLSNRIAQQQRLERELRDALQELDGKRLASFPTVGKPRLRTYTVVLFSVRKDNEGTVRRWEYLAPATTWDSEAEHLARLEAKKQGLVIHAHLDTFKETRV